MSKKKKNPNASIPRFEIGNGVFHKEHGQGEVKALGLNNVYVVRFDNSGAWETLDSKDLESRPKRGKYREFPRSR